MSHRLQKIDYTYSTAVTLIDETAMQQEQGVVRKKQKEMWFVSVHSGMIKYRSQLVFGIPT